MSRNHRLTMLGLAVVVAIAAVIVLRSTGDNSESTERANAPTPTPTATATEAGGDATPTPTPEPKKPERPDIPVFTAAKPGELEVKQGDTVRFAARATEDEEIHVHGYDLSKDAPAGKTVQMSFKATITGIFAIEFEHAGAPIAELKVEP